MGSILQAKDGLQGRGPLAWRKGSCGKGEGSPPPSTCAPWRRKCFFLLPDFWKGNLSLRPTPPAEPPREKRNTREVSSDRWRRPEPPPLLAQGCWEPALPFSLNLTGGLPGAGPLGWGQRSALGTTKPGVDSQEPQHWSRWLPPPRPPSRRRAVPRIPKADPSAGLWWFLTLPFSSRPWPSVTTTPWK